MNNPKNLQSAVLCEICSKEVKKYKCPQCKILYCSLSCYKLHKNTECAKRTENASIVEVIERHSAAGERLISSGKELPNEKELVELGDKVPKEQLEKLGENEKLKELLSNQHLRNYLLNLDKNPIEAIEKAMKEPIFLEFADECLKVVEPNRFHI